MYIQVHAVPGAKKERVIKENETVYEIHVREPAERNLANRRIREILAKTLGISTSQVRMLTGHRSSTKMYSIERK